MDIRCGSCNKLFRVADDKISGKGIRFKCSRCGEVITVTREELSAAPAAAPEAPPAPRIAVPAPAEFASQHQAPSEPPAQEFQAQEYQPPVLSTGMDDFDFSEPHAAAAASGTSEESLGGGDFSFENPAEEQRSEADAGGEISLSDEEEREAETAFQFPADIISEPSRKPAFASSSASAGAEEEAGDGSPAGSFAEEKLVPELTIDEERMAEPEPAKKVPTPVVAAKQPVSPPVKPAVSEDEEIDLGQALSIPKTIEPEKAPAKPAPVKVPVKAMPEMPDIDAAPAAPLSEHVHPLASGNVTGALAGLGCALPLVLLALFAFSLLARFVPHFASFPRYHILIVMGTGIVSLGVMAGIVISIVQAQVGRKLFFLLNVLIGAGFGLLYGAGMNTVTDLASGAGLNLVRIASGAVSGATVALLLSLLIVVARRILLFTKDESFAAQLSGPQKAGIALSLVIILVALYSEGTLVGSMEKSAQDVVQQVEEPITPDGLSVTNAQGYVDETGDLVISGSVQNGLDREKDDWYLEATVFDQHQKVLATVKMLNGVQLFDQRDLDILAKRGKNIDELKAGMILALQKGAIPAKGSANFEMRLMAPPDGIASFYPTLKTTTLNEAVGSVPGMQ